MKNKILYFIVSFTVFSCQSVNKPEKPRCLLEEEEMVNILTDIAFIKAAKGTFRKKLEVEKFNPEGYVLNKYNIDSITFVENNSWYTHHPEAYEQIFVTVKANLEKSKVTLEKLQKEKDSIKRVADSIRTIKKKVEDSLAKATKISNR